jgi:hypothetical protein
MHEFIDDEIEVHFARKPGRPTSLTWREKEYKIAEIKDRRRNLDFPEDWWRRRHRDHYSSRNAFIQKQLPKWQKLHRLLRNPAKR